MLDQYIVKNGTLLSIADGSEKKADILVENGTISTVAPEILADRAEVIDANGMFVTVGWLDAHCHFNAVREGSIEIGIEKDLLRQGVTYALDAGTSGPDNYEENRERLLFESDLKFRSYLNIADLGINGGRKDFESAADIEPEKVKAVISRFRGELAGLKARIDDKCCFDPEYVLEQLRFLGDELDLPVAVHALRSRLGIEKVLSYLKKGDVLAHTLAGNSDVMRVTDGKGEIKDCVLKARERGVIFDLSHGTNAYCYASADAAWKAGFFVDTISSDLHTGNLNGPVYNLGTVLTKVRGLTGKPWYWILNKAIAEPARLFRLPGKEIEIREGARADLTVFEIEKGVFALSDSQKEIRTFGEKATARYTCVGSHVYVCRR